ncbi:MAG TPA: alpha-amylase family glycosyl hydrolase [Stenomitos sp.]
MVTAITQPEVITSSSHQPSTRNGMGAIVYDGGTTFRVWAKFALQVYVEGDFNKWSQTATPLASEGNGYWSGDVPGAKPGDYYRYVLHNDEILHRADPYGKHVIDPRDKRTDPNDIGKVEIKAPFDWGDHHFTMPAWNELVIYELHVSSFNAHKGERLPGIFYNLIQGSPVNSDEPLGTFTSIIEKLDYLKDLGINAIELLPIVDFPTQTSLGYNPNLPFDIESSYGSPEDFKKFVMAAHERGIAIILDVVYNHFDSGIYDKEFPSLWRFDGWHQGDYGGIYFYNDWRANTDFGPRPDFGRDEVRHFIRDNALMWLEEYQLDGWRFDSTVNIRNAKGNNNDPSNDLAEGWGLMQWLNNDKNNKQPWKISIAEDLQNNEWITKDTGAGGAGFNSQWGSSFYWPIYNALISPFDSSRNIVDIQNAILHRFETDALKRVIYSENHDEVADINHKKRLPNRIDKNQPDSFYARKRSTLGAVFSLTSPGIPMLFQGQEFLEQGAWKDNVPLDWNNLSKYPGIYNLYKDLIHLRRNWYNNTRGLRGQHVHVHHVNDQDKVIAFHRWENSGSGDDVIVVVNLSNRAYDSYSLGFPQGGMWWVRFNSDWNGYSPDFENHPGYHTEAYPTDAGDPDHMPYRGNVGIGRYSALVLSQ